jgi:hypothetical protein
MTRDELWALFVRRNPAFKTGPIAFKPETLRKFFDLVWEKAQEAVPRPAPKPPVDLPDFMKDLGLG